MDATQGLERLLGAKACRVAYQHLAESDDRVQRRAQFVAHVGEETGLGATHRLSLIAGGCEGMLVVLAIGDVGVDDHKPAFRQRIVPISSTMPFGRVRSNV